MGMGKWNGRSHPLDAASATAEGGITMWQTNIPHYSEKAMLELLKKAPMEKLAEFLLLPRKDKTNGRFDRRKEGK